MSISNNPPPSISHPSRSVNDKQKIVEIKEYALNFLGCGYNALEKNPEQALLEKAVEDFPPEHVSVMQSKSQVEMEVGETAKKTLDKIRKKFGSKFNLARPVEIGISGCYDKKSSSKQANTKIVFAACHIDYYQCKLNTLPKLRKNLVGYEQRGDKFVSSAWVYTGFKIVFKINIQSQEDGSDRAITGEANLTKFAVLGGMANILSEKLKGKSITCIRMHAEGYGDYQIPSETFSLPRNLEEIDSVLAIIKNDYLSQLHQIKIRAYYIDQNCLSDFKRLSQKEIESDRTILTPSSQLPPITSKSKSKELEDLNFILLADEINKYNGDLQSFLNTIPLAALLRSISNVFKTWLNNDDSDNESKYPIKRTILLGNSGAGKSLLIAYMNGCKIVTKEVLVSAKFNAFKKVLDYEANGTHLPQIGHFNSKTKGAKVFGRYIDAAGYFDSLGEPEDLCNCMAIAQITESIKPNSAIIPIKSSDFHNRAKVFLELIRKLEKSIPKLMEDKVLSSVIFLVNDTFPTENKTQKDIQTEIAASIESLIQDINNAGGTDWYETFTALSRRDRKSKLKESDPRIPKYMEDLEILQKILEIDQEHNILLIGDFSKNTTRKIIERKLEELDTKKTTYALPINMGNVIDNGYEKFKNVLYYIAMTHRHFSVNKDSFNRRSHEINFEINALNTELREIGKILADGPETLEAIKNKIDKHQLDLNTERNALAIITADIDSKQNAIQDLKSNQTQIHWKFIQKSMRLRAFYHIGRIGKIIYTFEETGTTKINSYELKKDQVLVRKWHKKPGKWVDVKADQLAKGKFKAGYQPGWFKCKEDLSAKVELFVETCDHPATLQRISQLERELKDPQVGLIQKKGRIEGNIKTLEDRILSDKKELKHLKINGPVTILSEDQIKSLQQKEKEIQDKVEELLHEKALIQTRRTEFSNILEEYSVYFELIAKIVTRMKLDSNGDFENSDFKDFVKAVLG